MEIFEPTARIVADIDDAALDREMNEIVNIVLSDYEKGRDIDEMNIMEQPDPDKIELIIHELQMILYPGYFREHEYRTRNMTTKIHVLIEDVMYNLRKQIEIVLLYDPEFTDTDKVTRKRVAQRICLEYFRTIPRMREYMNTDILATFDGDPAACNKEEIILAYPGLMASSIYRMAHELHQLNVPLLPRMMTEYAHRITGVDIHPGATIGKYFFIDHATGIVVGSTSIIGEHVKVYQGVTIGALSTKLGHKLHGTRRHPTIEDDVTIYSGATILGGNTVIGEGSVIGGNAFVTKSVPPHSTVLTESEVTVK
jgi:serine O-acetyltransferase